MERSGYRDHPHSRRPSAATEIVPKWLPDEIISQPLPAFLGLDQRVKEWALTMNDNAQNADDVIRISPAWPDGADGRFSCLLAQVGIEVSAMDPTTPT